MATNYGNFDRKTRLHNRSIVEMVINEQMLIEIEL
jgi:hypothetical protein